MIGWIFPVSLKIVLIIDLKDFLSPRPAIK
jgi:hypothetical protein